MVLFITIDPWIQSHIDLGGYGFVVIDMMICCHVRSFFIRQVTAANDLSVDYTWHIGIKRQLSFSI